MRGTFAVYVEPGIVLTPELIRNRRKELNLTQAKFSARVGVSVETDSRWERGRLVPKKKTAQDCRSIEVNGTGRQYYAGRGNAKGRAADGTGDWSGRGCRS